MAQPATPEPGLVLPLREARTRFLQLVRLADLNRQTTTITDNGRAIAVITPPQRDDRGQRLLRRIDQVRDEVRRQHRHRITELEQALDEAWQALDDCRPPGSDKSVDALRVLHTDLRRPDVTGP